MECCTVLYNSAWQLLEGGCIARFGEPKGKARRQIPHQAVKLIVSSLDRHTLHQQCKSVSLRLSLHIVSGSVTFADTVVRKVADAVISFSHSRVNSKASRG
jgi:hypothetical protein